MASKNPLEAGAQYIADYIRLNAWATDEGNTEAQSDLSAISSLWFKELTGVPIKNLKKLDAQKAVQAIIWYEMLGGKDPFRGSRKALQDFKTKWKVK